MQFIDSFCSWARDRHERYKTHYKNFSKDYNSIIKFNQSSVYPTRRTLQQPKHSIDLTQIRNTKILDSNLWNSWAYSMPRQMPMQMPTTTMRRRQHTYVFEPPALKVPPWKPDPFEDFIARSFRTQHHQEYHRKQYHKQYHKETTTTTLCLPMPAICIQCHNLIFNIQYPFSISSKIDQILHCSPYCFKCRCINFFTK